MFVDRFMAWCARSGREERAAAVRDLAESYVRERIASEDIRAVEQVFLLLTDDPCVAVRTELARGLADCKHVPRTIVWTLLQDICEVSTILLEKSCHVRIADQIDALRHGVTASQCAVARRADICADVARLTVEIAEADAVLALLDNETVALSPSLKHVIATRLGDTADIRGALLDDDSLLPETRELLVARTADALKAFALQAGFDDRNRVTKTASDAAARAAVEIIEEGGTDHVMEYVRHLQREGRLTATLLARAACSGNAALFEAAVALLSGKSLARVQSVVDSGNTAAFRALYASTGLPETAMPVFQAALSVWRAPGCQEDAIHEIIHRAEQDETVDGALLALLGRMACDSERQSAQTYERQLLLAA